MMRRVLSVMLVAISSLLGLAQAFPAQAQVENGVFFLARLDTNQDGIISIDDENRLFLAPYATGVPTQLSPDGINATQFTVSPARDLAAISDVQPDGGIGVYVMDVAARTVITQLVVSDLTTPIIYLLPSGLWVVGTNRDNLPVVRGFDPRSGSVINERVTRRPDTIVTPAPSGEWMMLYHEAEAVMSVWGLPGLAGVPFELIGFAASSPVWDQAPTDRFIIGSFAEAAPTNLNALVVDVTIPQTISFDLPDLPVDTVATFSWSSSGRFGLFTPVSGISVQPTTLIEIATGDVLTTSISAVFSWSARDEFAAVLASDALGQPTPATTIQLYNTATRQLVGLAVLSAYEIYGTAWSTAGTLLAFVGQSLQNGQFGIYIYNPNDPLTPPTPLLETTDASLVGGNLQWVENNSKILYVANSGDLTPNTLGDARAIYLLSIADRSVVRVSPEESIVNLLQVDVR